MPLSIGLVLVKYMLPVTAVCGALVVTISVGPIYLLRMFAASLWAFTFAWKASRIEWSRVYSRYYAKTMATVGRD